VDSVQVLWRSVELARPSLMLLVDSRLWIADGARIHLLTETGAHLGTVGREGAGPGEFRRITQLGSDDTTVIVHDAALGRFSFFTPKGDYLRGQSTRSTAPFVNPVDASSLVPGGNSVYSLWAELTQDRRPTRTALIRHDLATDSTRIIEVWDGVSWSRMGDFLVEDPLLGPQVHAALSRQHGMAAGNGIDYCITLRAFTSVSARRFCRVRNPVAIGPGIRKPDLSPVPQGRREALAHIIPQLRVAEHLPHFDRLLFDSHGRLWVRTVGSELANIHPYVRRYVSQPAYRLWDVFDPSGRVIGAVEIPSIFDPQAISGTHMYGFAEHESGEIAIAVARVPF
jgi:hypothetical protein